MHVLKRTEVMALRETYQRSLLVILARFSRFLERTSFKKSYVKSVRCDRFQPENILNIIEHVSSLIRCCKISLLTDAYALGAVAFQTPGPVFLSRLRKESGNTQANSFTSNIYRKSYLLSPPY